ncbi:cellulose synthase-like protein g1 [Quercus suber]|uniref:Cellulose synthase-like protein g1 n=1 Tax=Quercus suber TaxID=58331 RepID=A0AAW0K0K2_QUESU
MEDQRLRGFRTSSIASNPPLHTYRHARRTTLNLVFMAIYTYAILAHLHHNAHKLIQSTTFVSLFITLSFFVSDIILAIVWAMQQCFRVAIIYRSEFPENLEMVMKKSDFPALDVFICIADPYKEPPIRLVSTALSVMAYDYPTKKISAYVSDDGGSQLTLFACMEAAKFASHWLPLCRKTKIIDRSPEAYFASNHSWSSDAEKIKVLLESSKNKDITDHLMPNLIYHSREKSKTSFHHFKAGALNVLLRVSAAMTNAPIILTLDCDMYSNDP